ncbi:zinc finger with UFM1-specific peptidase domain protein [Phalaenopsis equestris]|uniref:zinc finger with UFM1-specific peptidase domain protein n=1 Tax=Phalaenopsis equestris TaxID=78828 RepID=UPI0009E61F1A|nr:zinc finger with UFM1-specific peptidase domain protein [Phalaenopsis equestris]XP_020573225.1 zinc finger with UFM1-specific peptidase domain protein [Phalaenopsis equestris]
MYSICPFCQRDVLSAELQWHANNHFLEDDFEKDMQLAKQISLELPTSILMDSPAYSEESSSGFSGRSAEISKSTFKENHHGLRDILLQERISCLVGLQTKDTFYKVEGGLMNLLRKCLQLENRKSRSVISGYVDHYQSVQSEDYGWGCGWRNIQMLSSHLLMQRKEAKVVLFGGSEFVPVIPSLQRWLEVAWERGFDVPGSLSFSKEVYGSKKWIGATECATLFRSFGLRAMVVDFDSLPSSRKMVEKLVYGPMDKFLQRCQNEKHSNVINLESSNKGESIGGHQVLMEWIWNYFTYEAGSRLDDFQDVLISHKTPLYFQHDGHSRTIVGIQMQKFAKGPEQKYSLLILDPGQRTRDLEKTLGDNNGWQKLIKRGFHTLKKPQYQLCYIDPGVAYDEEWEDLKTIHSEYIRL